MLASERRASDAELVIISAARLGLIWWEQTSPGNVANDSFFEGSFRRGNAEEKDSESDS